jgi:hypothetical protein
LPVGEIGVAGMGAGLVMAFFNCPVELLKVKLQTQSAAGVIGANGKLEPPVSDGITTLIVHQMTPPHDIVCSTRELLIVVFEPAERVEY